ncbi:MAG: hypothetical protein IH953_00580 [Chloroflexi bacterium]|nr:hypothetical protein [Chloroflexota bacterium]
MKGYLRSKATRKHLEKRGKEDAAKNDERIKKQAERAMRILERDAKKQFIASGGDPADFQDAWDDGLKEEVLRDAVVRTLRRSEWLGALRL